MESNSNLSNFNGFEVTQDWAMMMGLPLSCPILLGDACSFNLCTLGKRFVKGNHFKLFVDCFSNKLLKVKSCRNSLYLKLSLDKKNS